VRQPEPESSAAAALRRQFDRSFSETRRAGAGAEENLLALRIGGDPYAARLSEIASLHADKKLVPLPSPMPDLLGLVSLRGALAPAYDLRTLLGYPRGPPPRFLIFVRTPEPVAFALDLFEVHLRLRLADISLAETGTASRFTCGLVRTAEGARPLLHIASLVEAITHRIGSPPRETP
jgi:chemotaxis signal transduction protein